MKKIFLIPTLLFTSALPLINLVGCNKDNKIVITFIIEGKGSVNWQKLEYDNPIQWKDIKDQVISTPNKYWKFVGYFINDQEVNDETIINQKCTIVVKFQHDLSIKQQIAFNVGVGQELGGYIKPEGIQTYWPGYTFGEIKARQFEEETVFPEPKTETDDATFVGWYYDQNCQTPISDDHLIDNVNAAFAKFIKNPSKWAHITYKLEGGSARGEIIGDKELDVLIGSSWLEMERPVVRCNDGWVEAGLYVNGQPITDDYIFNTATEITIKFQQCLTQDLFNFKINTTDKTAILESYKGEETLLETVIFPSWYQYGGEYYKVTQIGNNKNTPIFENTALAESIKSIVVPQSVNTIGTKAFWGCKNVESLSLPESLTTIKAGIFDINEKLTSINIPRNVSSINISTTPGSTYSTFGNCQILSTITVDKYNESFNDGNKKNCIVDIRGDTKKIVFGCKNTTIPTDVQEIGDCAFYQSSISSITIPNTIEKIGKYGFAESSLQNITFDQTDGNDLIISDYAFNRCSSLDAIVLPNRTIEVGTRAFAYTNLSAFNLPEKVTTAGSALFAGCVNMETLTIDPNNEKYSVGVNGQNCICELYEPSVGEPYYRLWSGIKTTVLPENLQEIKSYAFEAIPLVTITIREGVTKLESYVFNSCGNATTVTLPSTLTTIASSTTFKSCSNVQTLDLTALSDIDPTTLTKWQNNCFQDFSSESGKVLLNSIAQAKGWEEKIIAWGLTTEKNWEIQYV